MDFVCERLADGHQLMHFDCGHESLDRWLRDAARDSDGRNLTRTYVVQADGETVVGYYALMPYFIERRPLSKRQGRGLPDTIPCYLIARLALDRSHQGRGLGSRLLANALGRAAVGVGDLGGRFVVVDAIDADAESFHLHHGFDRVPGHTGRLLIPTKLLRP